jgi:hypothetical protein
MPVCFIFMFLFKLLFLRIMSGCGRKHRAKHLVGAYLDDGGWGGPDVSKGDHLASCIGSPAGKHVHVLGIEGPNVDKQYVVELPGKFYKVLWLRAGDVIVVRDGSVHYKPSPPQLRMYLEDKEELSKKLSTIQREAGVLQEERMMTSTQSRYGQSGGAIGRGTQEAVAVDEVAGDDDEEDLYNPNRASIKHQRAVFGFGEDDEEGEEEEGEEEGEEEEEK